MKQIEIKNTGNTVEIRWIWCVGDDVTVRIYVRPIESKAQKQDYGEELCIVRKRLSYALAEKEIQIGNLDSGEYCITLVPYINDEAVYDSIMVYDSVYLGMPRKISYRVEKGNGRENGMSVIRVSFDGEDIPARHLCVVFLPTGVCYPLFFPIASGERILMAAKQEYVELKAMDGFEDGYLVQKELYAPWQ